MMFSPDYQQVRFENGRAVSDAPRMKEKFEAIPWPDMKGKRVLDVGCDAGLFCWRAADDGAAEVVGLDRGRRVQGEQINIAGQNMGVAVTYARYRNCNFHEIEVGKQYRDYGRFDVAFVCSLYHHLFTATGGDHLPIWFWLRRQMKPGGELIWENPVDASDAVVRMNMPQEMWASYTQRAILAAASQYFDYELIGPARHEPTRVVYRLRAKPAYGARLFAFVEDGAKGASKAFQYADGRRMKEIEHILGFVPYVGSLNLHALGDFPWDENYYRAQMLDVADRSKGLESEWILKWMRFYPLKVNGETAYAMRFEGEQYPKNFVEVISEKRLNLPTLAVYKDYGKGKWANQQTGKAAVDVEITLEK